MSTVVDSRVVEMKFDNRQFEQNVSTTMSTLDKLKQSLKFTGATKGLEDVDSAARKVDFGHLGAGIEAVQVKFSTAQAVMIHQINNIVDSVMRAGKRMASALTIDPIRTGFSEYETQINSVQTILANTESKGSTLQDVNSALDTLNTYADKTIYNFTEMTRNIGTFTAAGVDLDKSVASIQGIANLAAVSGSSSQQASNAMYQLSQALAAGRVSLMDWNSVVNAGMGGQVFQDALKRTAKTMGIVVDESKSFRESIQGSDTWLSSEVLLKTLEQFTMAAEEGSDEWNLFKKSLMDDGYTEEQALAILKMANTATDAATKVKTFTQLWDTLKESAQSGWTQTWEIIVGDFGEAKEFLTKISETIGKMIGDSAEARNTLLEGGLSSGWKQFLSQGITDETGYKESIQAVAKEHGVAFDEIIKKTEEAGGTFEDALMASLKDGSITSDMLTESVTHSADGMRKLASEIKNMSKEEREKNGYTDVFLNDLEKQILTIEKLEKKLKAGEISMDEFAKKMARPSGRENLIEALWNAFNGLMSVITPVKQAFEEIFPAMTGEQLYQITERIKEFTSKLTLSGENAEKLKTTFMGVFSIIKVGWDAIKTLISGFVELLGHFTGVTGGVLDITSAFGTFLLKISNAIKQGDIFGKIVTKVVDILGTGIDKIKEFGSSLKESFKSTDYSGFVGFLKGVWEFILQVGTGLATAFGNIGKTVANIFGENSFGDLLESGGLAVLGVGLYKLIGNLNSPFEAFSDLVEGLTGEEGVLQNVIGIIDDVRGCFQAYQQQLQAKTLMEIAKAIGLLSLSIFLISTINPETLGQSLAAITVLFAELMGALYGFGQIMPNAKGIMKAVPLINGIASAMLILSIAMRIIGTMKPEQMITSLIGVAGGLTVLVTAVNFMPEKKVHGAARSIKSLSISLVILGAALKIIGSLSWEELVKGLTGVAVGLGVMVAALNLMPRDWTASVKGLGKLKADTNLISAGLTLIAMATAMKILASAIEDFSKLKWSELAKGLGTMAISMLIFVKAIGALPKGNFGNLSGGMISAGIGMIAMATAMNILTKSLQDIGGMKLEEIVKGVATIGASMFIMSKGLQSMTGTLPGSAALLVAAAALAVLVPSLNALGVMSLGVIVKGLITLAAAFAVIGVAAALLEPLTPAMLKLAGTFALFGVAALAFGAGLTLIGAGITSIATSLAAGVTSIIASITVIISGVLDLIPTIVTKLGDAIKAFAYVIGDCAPQIADAVLKVISEVLKSLVTYTPLIANSLFDLLIGILDVLSARMPELVTAAVKMIGAFFQGVTDALKSVNNTENLLKGVIAIGLLTKLMGSLAAAVKFVPGAMLGLVGVGLVMAELALVLAAIGGLAQIPGLEWLISEGGDLLQKIGTALGQFIGGIAGGIAQGFTSSLPQIGNDLSAFMTNIQPFIEGAKSINSTMLDGVYNLVGVMLALTGADFVNSLASFITGGSSLTDFADQLVPFGEGMKAYGEAIAGVDSAAITASATAAKALTTVVNSLPKSGGLAGLFGGEGDISSFCQQLVPLGVSLKTYSLVVAGIDAASIVASATAAKALAEMANVIPNEGGIAAWFAGENSIAKFGTDLIQLGVGLKGFSIAITGIVPESIIGAANAAKALADMMSVIPNEGGLVAWITGENSVSRFANDLLSLGTGLLGFSFATTGIVPENIIGAANAAKVLAEMMSVIPNEGGLVAWFTGENSVSKFAGQLLNLGMGLKNFSTATIGVVPENIVAAANAAKSLAEMANVIPNEGGVAAWFAGENSIAKFAAQLPMLGAGLLGLSMATVGIVPENISAAVNAAKAIAEMTTHIPTEGGVKAWFSGDSGIATFAENLPELGEGLAGFSEKVTDIKAENVIAAAGAAKAIAEMTAYVPTEGGIKAWFSGESGVATFAENLPALGKGLAGFSTEVKDITPENVSAAANAAKDLATMADTTPSDTGNLVTFGENLVTFSGSLKSYFNKIGEISGDTMTAASNAIKSMKDSTSGLNGENIKSAADAIKNMSEAVKSLSGIGESTVSGFSNAMKTLAGTSVNNLVKTFNDAGPTISKVGETLLSKFVEGANKQNGAVKKAGETSINKFNEGIKGKESAAKKACESILKKCVTALKGSKNNFASAGADVVKGFASGITANTYLAEAKAKAMAKAAERAAKEELEVNSPSKVFRRLGASVPEGFAQGIDRLGNVVKASSIGMTDTAIDGVKGAISKIADAVNTDIDTQPTIRPVLDLSNIKSGAGAINGMLGTNPSVGVLANVGSISSMMSRNQNGGNADVVSAINKLRSDLGNISSNTYQIGGVTYDDGSNVSSAVSQLIRAVKIERRI